MSGEIEVVGAKEVNAKLQALTLRLQEPSVILGRIEQEFYEIEVRQFATSGQGRWPALSPAYAARKQRTHPGQPLMVRDGELRESLTRQGGKWQVRRLTGNTLEIGTNRPGAAAHQDSKRSWLPVRKVIDISAAEVARWRNVYGVYVREMVHEVGLA